MSRVRLEGKGFSQQQQQLLFASSVTFQSDLVKSEEIFREANIDLKAGKYQEAITKYLHVISINKLCYPARFNLANAYKACGSTDLAIETCNETLRSIDDAIKNQFQRGKKRIKVSDYYNDNAFNALYTRAELFFEQGKYESAFKDFKLIIDTDKQSEFILHDKTRYLFALLESSQRRYVSSLEQYKFLAARNPTHSIYPYKVADDLAEYAKETFGDNEHKLRSMLIESAKSMTLALTLQDKYEQDTDIDKFKAHIKRGVAYKELALMANDMAERTSYFKKAKKDFEKAISLEPNSHDAHAYRMNICLTLGERAEAIKECDFLIGLNPDDFQLLNIRANIKLRLGQEEASAADYKEAIRIATKMGVSVPLSNLLLGEILLNLGRQEEAIEQFAIYAQLVPHSNEPDHIMGSYFLKNNDFEQALIHYQNIVLKDKDDLIAYRKAALCLMIINKDAQTLGQALVYAERAVAIEPDSPNDLYQYGLVLIANNRSKDAIPALKKALALFDSENEPDFVANCYHNIGVAYVDIGNYHEALTNLDIAAKSMKGSLDKLNFSLAVTHIHLGNTEKGREYLEQAELAGYHDQQDITFHLGMIEFKEVNFSKAKDLFSGLDDSQPILKEYFLGICCHKLGLPYALTITHLTSFINNIDKLEETYNQDNLLAEAYFHRYLAYRASYKYDLAINDCESLLELKPDQYNIRGQLAIMYYNLGLELKNKFTDENSHDNYLDMASAFEQSIRNYNKLIIANENNVEAHFNKAQANQALGRYEKAIKGFTTVTLLKPNYALAYHNRAFAKMDAGDPYTMQEVIADFSLAIEKDPTLLESHAARGMAYFKNNQFDKAREDFAKVPESSRLSGECSKYIAQMDQAERIKEKYNISPKGTIYCNGAAPGNYR
jgi:tetratricopeptide (TPR) repeat protein